MTDEPEADRPQLIAEIAAGSRKTARQMVESERKMMLLIVIGLLLLFFFGCSVAVPPVGDRRPGDNLSPLGLASGS